MFDSIKGRIGWNESKLMFSVVLKADVFAE